MDLNQNKFPLLSYILTQQDPDSHPPLQQNLLTQFPHLTNPKVLSSLSQAIPTTISQTHFILRALGPRPEPEAVSKARSSLAQMEQTGESKKEAEIYKALVRLGAMHEEYERQVMEVEERLVVVYKDVAGELEDGEVNQEVVRILKEAESGEVVERVDLSGRQLRLIPEAFGKLHGLLLLNLSHNQLEVLPDSVAGLVKLEELDVSSNLLEALPDSIGLLRNLKVLNVSGNKLKALPESIALCSSLVEINASFNNLISLPSNIGCGLGNVQRFSIQLNKIRFLPPSICELKSLRYLDAHFNELHGLPHAIGRLTNLEVLNLSSNFSDLTELPETIGDLINLKELDLSNNQIRALPDSFGRLENLAKLNLDENLLVIPPKEIVNEGAKAVREFMAKRWLDMMAEEQQRIIHEANQQAAPTGWFAWGTSLMSNLFSGISQNVSGHGGEKAGRDSYLDQQL